MCRENSMYSINICYDIFASYESEFPLEYVQPQSCQNRLHRKMHSHYYHSHTKLSNEFLLIHTHQALLHLFHSLI